MPTLGKSNGRAAVLVRRSDESGRELPDGDLPSIVVFDAEPDGAELLAAVRCGALGALTSDDGEEALADARRRVAAGEAVFSARQVRLLVDELRTAPSSTATALTRREVDVVRAIEAGMSVKQTATALGISPRTVDNVQRFLFRKLGVHSRGQAASRCRALGLLDDAQVAP
jgi:DNA-binding NarL/FixJ family response regulator